MPCAAEHCRGEPSSAVLGNQENNAYPYLDSDKIYFTTQSKLSASLCHKHQHRACGDVQCVLRKMARNRPRRRSGAVCRAHFVTQRGDDNEELFKVSFEAGISDNRLDERGVVHSF